MDAMISALLANSGGFWMPERASTYGNEVDWLFQYILWICVFFFALITVLLVAFVLRYRSPKGAGQASGPSHSTALELTWTLIPVVIVGTIFYFGFSGFLHMSVLPVNAYEIQVTGFKWGWSFTYPNGVTDSELHVPKDVPVRLVTQSQDVIHSLYVPAFRMKRDVVPGRYNKWWFQADKVGEYDIYCAAYCGTGHAQMRSVAHVHEMDDFKKWMDNAANWVSRTPPVEAGKRLYGSIGCAQCHSVDGSKLVGPSLKDLFGSKVTNTNGTTLVADEDFIRESILNPGRLIVAGYDNVMPSFQGRLKDNEISALIAYMKSISVNFKGELPTAPPAAANATTQPTTKPN